MEKMTKRQIAREETFKMLFEHEFSPEKTAEEIYADALITRGFDEDPYIKSTLEGVLSHLDEIREDISRHAVGWKTNRISPTSLSCMELCVYEMRFCKDIPLRVSLNEAIELCKRFDEEKARPFVNGVLNAVMKELTETEEIQKKA